MGGGHGECDGTYAGEKLWSATRCINCSSINSVGPLIRPRDILGRDLKWEIAYMEVVECVPSFILKGVRTSGSPVTGPSPLGRNSNSCPWFRRQ